MRLSNTRRSRGAGQVRDPCDLVETLLLDLPNRTALSTVHVGDILPVELRTGPPLLLVVMAKTGSGAGSIGSSVKAVVADCILAGHAFVAEVLWLEGTSCEVRLRRKR